MEGPSLESGEGGRVPLEEEQFELTTVEVRREKRRQSVCHVSPGTPPPAPKLHSLKLKPFTQGDGDKIIPKREMARQLLLGSQKGKLIYLSHLMKNHRLLPCLHYLPLHSQAPHPHAL